MSHFEFMCGLEHIFWPVVVVFPFSYDVPPELQGNVSMAAVWGAVHPSIFSGLLIVYCLCIL